MNKSAVIQKDSEQAPAVAESKSVSEVSDAAKTITIVRSSKFRHIEGKFRHRSTFISKLPSLSTTVPGDSNVVQVKVKCVYKCFSYWHYRQTGIALQQY